jgi:hypothetical protein
MTGMEIQNVVFIIVGLLLAIVMYQYYPSFMRREGFEGESIGKDNKFPGGKNNPKNRFIDINDPENESSDGSLDKKRTEPFADLTSYEGPASFGSAEAPAGCYPRDQLTPSELLPKDMNSIWAEQNPMGPGSLKGKNFLSAGALIGVNTVGQSLRNANLQIRSEPPNPQVPVSIFLQTTIGPDISHRSLEIN